MTTLVLYKRAFVNFKKNTVLLLIKYNALKPINLIIIIENVHSESLKDNSEHYEYYSINKVFSDAYYYVNKLRYLTMLVTINPFVDNVMRRCWLLRVKFAFHFQC